MDRPRTLSQYIERRRWYRRETLFQASKQIGVSLTTVWYWEHGQPVSPKHRKALSAWLGMSESKIAAMCEKEKANAKN